MLTLKFKVKLSYSQEYILCIVFIIKLVPNASIPIPIKVKIKMLVFARKFWPAVRMQ